MHSPVRSISSRLLAKTLLVAVFAIVGFAGWHNAAFAAGSPIQADIISPTSNTTNASVQLLGTNILFELQILSASLNNGPITLQWEFDYDGTDTDWPGSNSVLHSSLITITPTSNSILPLRYKSTNLTNASALRYTYAYPTTYALRTQNIRVRLYYTNDTEPVSYYYAYGKVALTDSLPFSGYTWLGAATAKLDGTTPNDAIGWDSFSCKNSTGGSTCSVAPTYAIGITRESGTCTNGPTPGHICAVDGDCGAGGSCGRPGVCVGGSSPGSDCATNTDCGVNGYCSQGTALSGNGWLGEASPNTAGSLGWFSFGKGICVNDTNNSDPNRGKDCFATSDCGGLAGASCSLLGTPPTQDGVSPTSNNHLYTTPDSGAGRSVAELAGWARFLTMRDYGSATQSQSDWGWVHLRGPEAPKSICQGGSQDGTACIDPNVCSAGGVGALCHATTSGSYTDVTKGYQLCGDCSTSGGKCNVCQKVQLNAAGATANYACNSCYDCGASGNTTSCTSCEVCRQYGISYNSQLETLVGYAYAGGTAGLGWMRFNPDIGGINVLQSWLATRYGDVFVNQKNQTTGSSITTTTPLPSPPGQFNATYVIQANGTVAFTTRQGSGSIYYKPNYSGSVTVPSAQNQYINVLGRLNFGEFTKSGTSNRFGPKQNIASLLEIPTASVTNDGVLHIILNGTQYYLNAGATGTVSIPAATETYTSIEFDQGTTMTNGNGVVVPQSGAGTFIVDGNLNLNVPVSYQTGSISNGSILNVPSVGWVVRGNVTVNPLVDRLDGAFIVVGCNSTPLPVWCPSSNITDTDNNGEPDNDGFVYTGASSTLALTVNGLLMARHFAFQRTVASTDGSEQVVFNGNIFANPPPGLNDLTAVLPQIQEETP